MCNDLEGNDNHVSSSQITEVDIIGRSKVVHSPNLALVLTLVPAPTLTFDSESYSYRTVVGFFFSHQFAKVFIIGHHDLVGSAIIRKHHQFGFTSHLL